MTDVKDAAVVLFSGGQDSTTCLFWAKKQFKTVYALSFVYGQKHVHEVELAKGIAERAGVEFHVMDVSFISQLGRNSLTDTSLMMDEEKPADSFPNTFVPGRNLFFLSIAAVFAREREVYDMATMGRKRANNPLNLPDRVYAKHGAFYYELMHKNHKTKKFAK